MKKLNISEERDALLRRLVTPVAEAPGPDRKIAQGILFSLGWAERKGRR